MTEYYCRYRHICNHFNEEECTEWTECAKKINIRRLLNRTETDQEPEETPEEEGED